MENDFLKLQEELNTKIASALLDIIPEHWYSIELKSKLNPTDFEGDNLGYSISNPDGERDLVFVSDEILEHCVQLEQLFVKHKSRWKSFSFKVLWDDEIDRWRFIVDYNYPMN